MNQLKAPKRRLGRDAALSGLVLVLSVALLVLPAGFESPFAQKVSRVRGQVLEVDNSLIQQFGIVKAGSQVLIVKILNGPYEGQQVEASNNLIGKMETDKMFQVGDIAFLVLDAVEEGRAVSATAYDHYRLNIELLLVVLFAVLMIGFAGWGGVRALLSFFFALLLMWKVLFPNILLGKDPVLIALAVVTGITAVTLYLVAGVNKTAWVALLGSLLGILLTTALAMILLPAFRLHGAIQPFTETLLYSGFEHLNLTRVFLAAIFIGASGAVLDVAIDVSTAMSEVIQKRPDLARRELITSGFVVGRNMTSTMVTTLLMAYASGYMALLMVFMAQGIPPLFLLNTNYLAAEILKTIVGSFGLVTVAPFTAIVGGFIYVGQRGKAFEHEPRHTLAGPNPVQD
ncbi:MAG: YibE/F family protein [Chloroflexota bacterium]